MIGDRSIFAQIFFIMYLYLCRYLCRYMIRYFMQYDYSLLFLSTGVVLLIDRITLN